MEPIAGRRADLNAALIASTIVNMNLARGATPRGLTDFAFDWYPQPKPAQTMEEQIRFFEGFAKRHNARLEARCPT